MMQLALWFLAAFGFAFVVGHSRISLPLRQWLGGWIESGATPHVESGEVVGHITTHLPAIRVLGPFLVALAECPGCLGWWLGLGAGALGLVVLPFPFAVSVAVLAFATSAVNLLLSKYVGMT
jgi:hypothetical protein